MSRVEMINQTGEEIMIQEGNAGIYRDVKKISKDGRYSVAVDMNATYREFVCVESKSGLKATLTSDDCIDYSEVKIKYEASPIPRVYVEPTKRKSRGISDAATDANIGRTFRGALSWFFRKK